jgi:hypothetical protein
MLPKFAVRYRGRSLTTRFDADSEDRNDEVFSVQHRREVNGEYWFGVVRRVYSARMGPQTYRVLYDGDRTHMKSAGEHLEPEANAVRIIFVVRVLMYVEHWLPRRVDMGSTSNTATL